MHTFGWLASSESLRLAPLTYVHYRSPLREMRNAVCRAVVTTPIRLRFDGRSTA